MSYRSEYYTFAMIKPDVLEKRHLGKVLSYIESRGFIILKGELQTLSKPRAREFYQEHDGKPFFDGLIDFTVNGPVFPMLLEANRVWPYEELNAIDEFRKLIGSTNPLDASGDSIRGIWGLGMPNNAIHASDSLEAFLRESDFFFGGK